jgi:OOP family OmpA-OmpF porin
MQRSLIAASLAVLLAAPLAALAQSTSTSSYVKLGFGEARADIDFWGKDSATAASLAYGMQINPNFDVEAGYINFGTGNYAPSAGNTLSARSESIFVAAVGKFPIQNGFSVYGKLGASYHWNKWTGTSSGTAFNNSDERLAPMFGIGASWQFMQNWAADLEYAYFNDAGKDQGRKANIDMWTVGIKYLW